MMARMKYAIFVFGVLGLVFLRADATHAAAAVVRDEGTVYRISTQPSACYGDGTIFSCALGPAFRAYAASSSFTVTEIDFYWQNAGGNNCTGYGYYGAIITAADNRDSIIATSTDTAYLGCAGWSGGTHGEAAVHFRGELIPEDFRLTFGAFDGMTQGGSDISVRNVTIYGVPKALTPVVIIPGIMGSTLTDAATGQERWPNADELANSDTDDYLDALSLPGAPIVASDILREATGTYRGIFSIPIPFRQQFYGPLIDTLAAAGYREGESLFVAPYDWRSGVRAAAAEIAPIIQNAAAAAEDGKIIVIAHSMGGLVAKEYLAEAPGSGFLDKLIFLGVPQLGAPLMFKVLQYGDDIGFHVGPVQFLDPGKIKAISQGMPGVYELLPSRRYTDIEGGYVIDARPGSTRALSFDETNAYMTADPSDARSSALIAAAESFHAARDIQPAAAPAVYNVVGCGKPTAKAFVLGGDGSVEIVRGNGDGSVPVTSAMNLADGYKNYFVLNAENGVDHAGLVRDPASLALIRAIVSGTADAAALNGAGISERTQDCIEGRSGGSAVEIVVHAIGSMVVGIVDAVGRRIGNTPDGRIDLQIPGGSYEEIGDNYFITVPGGGSSTLMVQPVASGTAMVKVKKYDGKAAVKDAATYTKVSLGSASTTATLSVSDAPAADPLSIDADGDGTEDGNIPPVAVPPDALEDVTPPAIAVSPLPATATVGMAAALFFSFSDAESGIATSSASMNGAPVLPGEIVFGAYGTATFRFSAMDKAGNTAKKEYAVRVFSVPLPRTAPAEACAP